MPMLRYMAHFYTLSWRTLGGHVKIPRPPGSYGDHRGPDGGGGRSPARQPRRLRRARPAQWQLCAPSVDRARRHQAQHAAHPAFLPDRGAEDLSRACSGGRPRHPGRLRARALDSQGGRGLAGPARLPGLGRRNAGRMPSGGAGRGPRCRAPRPAGFRAQMDFFPVRQYSYFRHLPSQ